MEIRTILAIGKLQFNLNRLDIRPDQYLESLGGQSVAVTYEAEVEYIFQSERGGIIVTGKATASSAAVAGADAVADAYHKLKELEDRDGGDI